MTSTCPKCSNTSFEVKNAKPRNSEYIFTFIQCSSCGAVVGTIDYVNVPELLERLAKKLGVDLN